MKIWVFMSVLAILGFTFNNCSKLEVAGEEEAEVELSGEEEVFMAGAKRVSGSNLYSLQSFGQIARDQQISFAINPAGFLDRTTFIWDHKLIRENGDIEYCDQRTDMKSWIIHLVCPQPGQLELDVMAILPDQSDQRFNGAVSVLGEPRTDLPEDEDDGGGMPTMPLSGQELYAFNCQGCHRPLATSEVRGRSGQAIQNAINTQQRMRFLSFLTVEDIVKIAQVLQ